MGNRGCKVGRVRLESERKMWGASACGHASFTFAMASQLFENARRWKKKGRAVGLRERGGCLVESWQGTSFPPDFYLLHSPCNSDRHSYLFLNHFFCCCQNPGSQRKEVKAAQNSGTMTAWSVRLHNPVKCFLFSLLLNRCIGAKRLMVVRGVLGVNV